eukprot:scaffold22587_cov70-Cyclotella_meneghiniana.AAC.7
MAYGPILDVPKYTVRGDINDKEGAVQSYIPPMKPIKHVMLGSCIKFLGVGFTPSLQISEKQNSFFVWSKYKTATYISVEHPINTSSPRKICSVLRYLQLILVWFSKKQHSNGILLPGFATTSSSPFECRVGRPEPVQPPELDLVGHL